MLLLSKKQLLLPWEGDSIDRENRKVVRSGKAAGRCTIAKTAHLVEVVHHADGEGVDAPVLTELAHVPVHAHIGPGPPLSQLLGCSLRLQRARATASNEGTHFRLSTAH